MVEHHNNKFKQKESVDIYAHIHCNLYYVFLLQIGDLYIIIFLAVRLLMTLLVYSEVTSLLPNKVPSKSDTYKVLTLIPPANFDLTDLSTIYTIYSIY